MTSGAFCLRMRSSGLKEPQGEPPMKRLAALAAFALLTASTVSAQVAPDPGPGPIKAERFHTQYVRLGSAQSEALLYEPTRPNARGDIALVYTHPNSNVFTEWPGPEMASRGYRILMMNYRGGGDGAEAMLPTISRGIAYMRAQPGVKRVILVGHSGGAPLTAFYDNVAENGPKVACQGPEKLYPCRAEGLADLQKPDGLVLLDPTLGAFHQMSATDPAFTDKGRDPALDMFSPANGYDRAAGRATYGADFSKRFYAAQAARNGKIVSDALARLKAIEAGTGAFSDDEPLVIPGMGVMALGARLYQPDTRFVSHTRSAHTWIKADGTIVQAVVQSARPPSGAQAAGALRSLNQMTQNTTVRRFLAASAIRTGADFAITEDDIKDVDWTSAFTATPGNAQGITVPTLLMTMGCHYLVVPGEITFDRLAAKDKTFAGVEGATHLFNACKPEYGNTTKRVFDFVDAWLTNPGRF